MASPANAEQSEVLLINKPVGVISTCHDPQGRPTVLDLLPRSERRGLHPIGRLDADSRGALLLTDQGLLTLRLTHPRFDHEKTYRVWVDGHPLSTGPAAMAPWDPTRRQPHQTRRVELLERTKQRSC